MTCRDINEQFFNRLQPSHERFFVQTLTSNFIDCIESSDESVTFSSLGLREFFRTEESAVRRIFWSVLFRCWSRKPQGTDDLFQQLVSELYKSTRLFLLTKPNCSIALFCKLL